MTFDNSHWQQRFDDLATECGVPGASFALLVDGEVHTLATGVLNIGTGVTTTVDSVFQIGSITKVWTATVIMQLVDEGLVDLAAPIRTYLPDFELSSPGLVDAVTVRHLLSHTGGIDGDYFLETGRGDDALQRYVDSCKDIGMTHPPGAMFSYCNTGFSLLGSIIEKVTGGTWEQAVDTRIVQPLGLTSTVHFAEDALRFRVAYGHGTNADGAYLAPTWALARSAHPAGGIIATAADVVSFARAHLDAAAGATADPAGQGPPPIISAAAANRMLEHEVVVPDASGGSTRWWGLGWSIRDWNGRLVHGHDGGTIGQSSFLRVVPDAGVAAVLLANGGRSEDLYRRFVGEVLAAVCDLQMPPAAAPPASPVTLDNSKLVGTYERWGQRIEISEEAGRLRAKVHFLTALSEELPDAVVDTTLHPVRENFYVLQLDEDEPWSPLTFLELPDGSQYAHVGRAAVKTV